MALRQVSSISGPPTLWFALRKIAEVASPSPTICIYGRAAAWKTVIRGYMQQLWPAAQIDLATGLWQHCLTTSPLYKYDLAVQTMRETRPVDVEGILLTDDVVAMVIKSRWTETDFAKYKVAWPETWRAHV